MAILVENGVVGRIGPSTELIAEYAPWYPSKQSASEIEVLDVHGMAIVPGFVDCHTHLVWAGDRSNELAQRQSGKSYKDIASSGGGIRKTVMETRAAPIESLVESGVRRVSTAISNGTTSIEAKSGYGLDLESEVKLLEAISMTNRSSPCNIVPTWLGGHDFPPEMSRGEYVEHLINDQLPVISELSLARWADVFCEEGWYNHEETERIVKGANEHGLGSRLHVDEFVDSGGLALAAELGSVSGDHAACSNEDSRILAAESGTVQTFLPGTPYVLGSEINSPIKQCIQEDWPFATATDFNPNCPTISLPFIGSLLSHRLEVDPIVSLVSVTRNPSTTMFDDDNVKGVIAEGNSADLNVLWSGSADSWCQTPGSPPVRMTMINGSIVNSNEVY